MAVEFEWRVRVPSSVQGLDSESIGPITLELDESDITLLRREKVLEAGKAYTLDRGDLTPWLWIVQNTHATVSIEVGFGQAKPILLEPGGIPAIWTGSSIPVVTPVGGASKVWWLVVARNT